MVVDMSKFTTDEDVKKVISACHQTHNVPDFRNLTGPSTGRTRSSGSGRRRTSAPSRVRTIKYMSEHIKEMPFFVLCNHCDNPPCVRVCPTKATFKLPDGITMQDDASLHRMPVLHGRMSLWGAELQLERSPRQKSERGAVHQECEQGIPDADKRRGGKMHVLYRAACGGETSSLR